MAVIRQRLNFPTLLNFLGPITFGEYTVGFTLWDFKGTGRLVDFSSYICVAIFGKD